MLTFCITRTGVIFFLSENFVAGVVIRSLTVLIPKCMDTYVCEAPFYTRGLRVQLWQLSLVAYYLPARNL
jgi:hypothetical protein